MLAQRLADPLDDAAMRLAVDQRRVDHDAEIVDEGIANDVDRAGLRVDLDLGDVAAVRKGRGRAVADVLYVKALRQPGRQFQPGMELFGQFHQTDRAVGPNYREPARAKFDVGDRRLQHMRGDLSTLLDDLLARLDDRRAARHHRFRAAGAAAGDQRVAVTLQQADFAERDAEPWRQDLGEGRSMTLTVVEGAGDDRDRAVGLEADAAHFAARRAGQFEIVADAAAAQPPPRPTLRPPRGKAVPISKR